MPRLSATKYSRYPQLSDHGNRRGADRKTRAEKPLSRITAANRRDALAVLERMEIDTHPDNKSGMVSDIDFILSLLVNKFRFSTNKHT